MIGSLFVAGREVDRKEDIERRLLERRLELTRLRRAVTIARDRRPTAPAADVAAERCLLAHAQQGIARQALAGGDFRTARAAARSLRVTDFAGDTDLIEGLLGVVRDSRSGDDDVTSAIARLCASALVGPCPDPQRTGDTPAQLLAIEP